MASSFESPFPESLSLSSETSPTDLEAASALPSPPAVLSVPELVRPDTFSLDADGQTQVGGVPIAQLVERFQTPLYVLDAETIRHRARQYRSIERYYGKPVQVVLAAKANLNLGLCKLMQQEGLGLDVVSAGELHTAIQAGFPMDRVLMNGNNKSADEMTMAIHYKVGRLVVDNLHELEQIHRICQQKNTSVDVLLRVVPGIECHTHEYIRTGQRDTKFGFDLAVLPEALAYLVTTAKDTIRLRGLQAHIGSQIFEQGAYDDLIEVLLNIFYNIRENYQGLTLDEMDIGGGLGVSYTELDDPPAIEGMMRRIAAKVTEYAARLEYPLPKLYLEPGRSLVATAGLTLYTVGGIKHVPDVRTFVSVDGGMGDNIRPSLYGAVYTAMVANKPTEPASQTVTVVGKYCESGDVLIQSFKAPASLTSGDTLLVFGTGAYNYSMSSNYNRIPRPATVLVENGKAHLLVRRETLDDLIALDQIPETLQSL
ncbi:MAG: diaminopimelate decarboxylase [Candidatus Melainabacteria bacterium]|nr:diaminopimelate decarboxylase [Candidatus Melainabacteria bacterium]